MGGSTCVVTSNWNKCRCTIEYVMANEGQPGQPGEQVKWPWSKVRESGSLRAALSVRAPAYL